LPSEKFPPPGKREVGGVDLSASNAGERLAGSRAAPPTPYDPEYLRGLDLTAQQREEFRLAGELHALPPEEQLGVFWMFVGMHSACDEWNEDMAEALRCHKLWLERS
jgi:hypothetical protein